MLGRLRMSVADSINAYLKLSDRVFCKTRHKVTIKGKIQGRFDSDELARAVREVVKQQGLPEEALLKDAPEAGCKVFVCVTSKETSETACLMSYRSRGGSDLLDSVKIWEACRATSAASSFFDPIAVGPFGEEFVDGATGANNPVREVWDQAQLVWGPEPLEARVKCLVSIGTGVPLLKSFKNDVFNIGKTLVAIATETEVTAQRFMRERPLLNNTKRYYRFNVLSGLEDIGLEEAKKVKEMAAATRRYLNTQEVYEKMQTCAGNMAGKSYFGEYQTVFSLEGVPRVSQFVDRPAEMAKLERVLLAGLGSSQRQRIHVVRGLGGIGKTQLAVEFARQHHRRFSSVFWLDGASEESVKRSLVSCASRIPRNQISETSTDYAADSGADANAVVREVMDWLARPDNTAWLLIIDNVDREYNPRGGDPLAYDLRRYLSGADHGSILITTRLARLEQLGDSQQLDKVDPGQAQAMFGNWYKGRHDEAEGRQLLELLDGLPLAIAQAGAYLQETGVGIKAYLQFYQQQWSELMELENVGDAPLQDYPNRSVGTTWAISYQAIRDKDEATANLLLLWSFLNNKNLWYGLFKAASQYPATAKMLSKSLGTTASDELKFSRAMQMLRNYSLIEQVEETASYATHPVVHRWAYHHQGKHLALDLGRLAVVIVGSAVTTDDSIESYSMPRRLLPHAQACSEWVVKGQIRQAAGCDSKFGTDLDEDTEDGLLFRALGKLGSLYSDQGKLTEAEQMYESSLRGWEEVFGPSHSLTMGAVISLGNLYKKQGRLAMAEAMYQRVLQRYRDPSRPFLCRNDVLLAVTFSNLGDLYKKQKKLDKAEEMLEIALRRYDMVLGSEDFYTLTAVTNLGGVYKAQGEQAMAERMFKHALRGMQETHGIDHTEARRIVCNLGVLYREQGRLVESEQMCGRVLRGYEEAVDRETLQTYQPALNVLEDMGSLYAIQGWNDKALGMYSRALSGGTVDSPQHRRLREYIFGLRTSNRTKGLMEERLKKNKSRTTLQKQKETETCTS